MGSVCLSRLAVLNSIWGRKISLEGICFVWKIFQWSSVGYVFKNERGRYDLNVTFQLWCALQIAAFTGNLGE